MLNDFLVWLASSAGAIMAFSWIAENFHAWHVLNTEQKRWYSFIGSALLSLAAWAIMTYVPPEVLEAVAVPFAYVGGVFVNIFLKDKFHAATKLP